MKLLDILLLILLIWGGYRGFKKGLIWEIFSTGALVAAVLGSTRMLSKAVALCTPWLGGYGQDELLPYVVFVCLFIIILLSTTVVGKVVKALIKPTVLGSLDKLLGGILGIFKWSTSMSTLLWLGSLVQLKIPEAYTENTFLFPIIEALGPQLLAWCSPWVLHIQDWFTAINTQGGS